MAETDLGMRIRRARERKRWSQEQLAAVLGVGARSVGRWERGEATPRNAIGALEDVLGVDLTGAEEPDLRELEVREMASRLGLSPDDWAKFYRQQAHHPSADGDRARRAG